MKMISMIGERKWAEKQKVHKFNQHTPKRSDSICDNIMHVSEYSIGVTLYRGELICSQ